MLEARKGGSLTTHMPSEKASVTGVYVLMNPAGSTTDVRVAAIAGTACPVAPRGWIWQLDASASLPSGD
jgi:hypothetical protein